MARQPKAWYWSARKGWYVEINGKQHLLGKAPKKTAHPPDTVQREFYRLMAADGRLEDRQRDTLTLADAAEAYLAARKHTCRASTYEAILNRIGPIAAAMGTRRFDSIRGDDVVAFVARYQGRQYNNKTFSDASRYLMLQRVKALFRWARLSGLADRNLLHDTPNPWTIQARKRGMTPEEYDILMSAPGLDAKFKEIIEIVWRTGARPGEIAVLEARHLDPTLPIVRLGPKEYKTGGKTGLDREYFPPADLMERLRRYAAARPEGKILQTVRGKDWKVKWISQRFERAKIRLGLPDDLVLYMGRHAYITRLYRETNDLAITAKIAGHTHAATIQKTYLHHELLAKLAAVAKLDATETERVSVDRPLAKNILPGTGEPYLGMGDPNS